VITSRPSSPRRRLAWYVAGLALVAFLVYLMATADTGPVDPTEVRGPQSVGTVVLNSAIIVFREGLEAVLIFAAVTASLLGANRRRRRPMVVGVLAASVATVATWFVVQAVLDVASPLGPRLEAITGFVAIVVLLVVLNWFVHNVYWTGWIARHHRQRRRLLASSGVGATIGLVVLGFTSVFREGFEVVLFLQTLELQQGTAVVLEGVGFGLLGTALVGVLTFALHRIPPWLGAWFEVYPTYEGIAIQVLTALLVVGSYYLAEYLRFRRPVQRGAQPAVRAESAPTDSAVGVS